MMMDEVIFNCFYVNQEQYDVKILRLPFSDLLDSENREMTENKRNATTILGTSCLKL